MNEFDDDPPRRDRPDDRSPRRSRRDDDYDDRPRGGSNTPATIGLVLGVVSLCLSILAALPAIIFSVIGLTKARSAGTGKGAALAGLFLGCLGLIARPLLVPAFKKARDAATKAYDTNNFI